MLFEKLKTNNQTLWKNYTNHIFAHKLVNEAIDTKSFDFYIGQDYHYLLVYLEAIEKLSSYPQAKNCFGVIADGVKLELQHHTSKTQEANQPSKKTQDYIDFLKRLIYESSYEELLIAIAPCLVGYYELGVYISGLKVSKNNRYSEWIELYSDVAYKQSSDTCIDLVNQLSTIDFEKCNTIFAQAVELEIAFFDQVVDYSARPIVLTIAGSDSSGGAGIQADLKAISANHCYGASVITTITAQSTSGVTAIYDLPTDLIKKQFETVVDDLDVRCIKIGMLSSTDIIQSVFDVISKRTIPYVLDPVMVAKDETKLLRDNAIALLLDTLIKNAFVITPNIPEAQVLTGLHVESLDDMKEACLKLTALGAQNILLKGGHMSADELIDLLYYNKKFYYYKTTRVLTQDTHGTGCTLSSALASYLALGFELNIACEKAIEYVQEAIIFNFKIGKGRGPVNHFYKLP